MFTLYGHENFTGYSLCAHVRINSEERKNFLSPRRVSPFLAWGDFHARSRFARSTIPEEKCGTTRSLE